MNVGDSIAEYEIVARLKAGGMAALYLGRRARAGGFAKTVAIKIVHEHLAENEEFISMFLDEARITARIEHPNVVHVHDLGEADGKYFLVMEYVPGCALSQLMRAIGKQRRRLSPVAATWIAMQTAAGLHAAHETTDDEGRPLGLVHRDVSPKNILLAYKGYVKLIDFGIAKAAGRATHTAAGLLKGTFRYMSPEQARGRALDARSDVFALGVVLWEMLTSRRLFDAENDLALLDQVRDPQIVPPGQLVGGIPPALDAVVMRALSKDPAARPETADAFRMELAQAVPGALATTARQIGELVSLTMGEPPSDPSMASSVVSALGKPLRVPKPAEVLQKLTLGPGEAAPMEGAAALKVAPQPTLVTPTGSAVHEVHSGVVAAGSASALDHAPTLVTPSHPASLEAAVASGATPAPAFTPMPTPLGARAPGGATPAPDGFDGAPARRGGRRWLGLALGALLLVGAGVAGAVVMGGRGASPTSTPLAPASGPAAEASGTPTSTTPGAELGASAAPGEADDTAGDTAAEVEAEATAEQAEPTPSEAAPVEPEELAPEDEAAPEELAEAAPADETEPTPAERAEAPPAEAGSEESAQQSAAQEDAARARRARAASRRRRATQRSRATEGTERESSPMRRRRRRDVRADDVPLVEDVF